MEWLTDPATWPTFAALVLVQFVLGIGTVLFLSVATARLPARRRRPVRLAGLALALGTQLVLLLDRSRIVGPASPRLEVAGPEVRVRDVVLVVGGLVLIGWAIYEIIVRTRGPGRDGARGLPVASLAAVVVPVALMVVAFSVDAVAAAAGVVERRATAIAATVVAVGLLAPLLGPVGELVGRHRPVALLALGCLALTGVGLVAAPLRVGLPLSLVSGPVAVAVVVGALIRWVVSRAGRAAEPAPGAPPASTDGR